MDKHNRAIRPGHLQPLRRDLRLRIGTTLLMLFMLVTSIDAPKWLVGLLLFNVIFDVFLVVSYFRSRHRFDRECITFGRIFWKSVTVRWREITAVDFSKANYALVLKSSKGSHQIPMALAGIVEFAEMMRQQVPSALVSQVAAEKLVAVETGEIIVPPEADGPVLDWQAELFAEFKTIFAKPVIRRWSIFLGLMMVGGWMAMEGLDLALHKGIDSPWALVGIAALGVGIPGFFGARLLKSDEVLGKPLAGHAGLAMVILMLGPIVVKCLIEGIYVWAGVMMLVGGLLGFIAMRSKTSNSLLGRAGPSAA